MKNIPRSVLFTALAGVLLFNYGAAWLGKRRQAASIQ